MIAKEYTKMSKVCPVCGSKIDSNAIFCTNCGASLAAKAAETAEKVEAVQAQAENDVKDLENTIDQAITNTPVFGFAAAEKPAETAASKADEATAVKAQKEAEKAQKEAEKAQKEAEKKAAKEAEKAQKEAARAAREADKKAAKESKKGDSIVVSNEAPKSFKSVGTGGYFFLMLLFAIPVIGWLACILLALAAKNPSLKNFARAKLVWLVIGLILAILATLGLILFGQQLVNLANSAFGTNLSGLSDLWNALVSGQINPSDLIGLLIK